MDFIERLDKALYEVQKGTTGRRTGRSSGGNPGSMDTPGTEKRPDGGPGWPYRDPDLDAHSPTKRKGMRTPGRKTISRTPSSTVSGRYT